MRKVIIRGALSCESDMISEVLNLPSDKLYEIIKIFSRSLCKLRDKYIELKKVKINLESQL